MSRWLNLTPEQRFWSKVDKSGDCWIWTASKRANGYGQFMVSHRNVTAHSFSYQLHNGPAPTGFDIDHACRNRACVNPAHLRLTTRKQNMENSNGWARTTPRGVSWDRERGLWSAKIGHNRKTINVGRFERLEDAESAVKAKRLELFTHNELDKKAVAS